MVKNIIIIILAIICFSLIIYILIYRSKLKELIYVLKSVKKNNKNKLFVSESGLFSEVGLATNELIRFYHAKLIDQKRTEQANKELMTSLSHDVRTPLSSLLGYLDALDSDILGEDEKIKYIRTSRKKAYDLKVLVDDLFEWFKIGSREIHFSPEVKDINELLRENIIEWGPAFERNKISLVVDISDDEYNVNLDENAFNRIISNLLQNALQYGGDFLEFEIQKSNSYVEIHVKDNGEGIDEENQRFIFDRLYKCDKSRSNRGSGLGLSIAKEFIEMHNGKICVKSKPGFGTEFILYFPIL
nr:HAMP domain-containing sensor histidine kinase [Clostridioides sp.]